jgi:hypothetical protein
MTNTNKEISISEFKKHCLQLIEEAKNKNITYTITKRKIPMVNVAPILPSKITSFFGCAKNFVSIIDDIVSFDTATEWEALQDDKS